MTGEDLMKLYHVRTLKHLEPYKKTWDHILEVNQNTNPFIEYQWVENWWRYLGEDRSVELLVVEKDKQVIAFSPFQFSRKWNTTVIEFIGRGEANYMDLIVYDDMREEAIQFVFDELMRLVPKCIFNLHGLLSSSATTNMLKLYLAKRNCEPTVFSVVTPFINMEAVNLEDYMKKRRKIHGLDRREKRLRNLGEVKVATSNSNEIDCVFSLHDKRWKQKQDTSQFTNETHKKFYTALLELKEGPMQAKVEGLYLDNQLIAFSYGYFCRGRFLGYVIGHDDDYGIYGPGTILDKELISRLQNNTIRIFDLSIGYEPYKFEWNTGVDYTNNFMFSTNELQTNITYQLIRGKGQIREALKKNYKIVLFKREFIGSKLYFLKNSTFKDWLKAIRRLGENVYSKKSIDIYKQSQGIDDVMDYEKLDLPKIMQRHTDLPHINKRFYNGFFPYSDSSNSIFWVHPKSIRVDEVGYLQPLPKESVFIVEWQTHKLSSISSYLRQDKKVKDIFLHTSKRDPYVRKHLEQLGFIHVNQVKKTCILFKTTNVSTYPKTKE